MEDKVDLTKIKSVFKIADFKKIQGFLDEGWIIMTIEPEYTYDDSNKPIVRKQWYHLGHEDTDKGS
jgi:hypothetical protein